jgi:predicted nucleic acid-binding protein
MIVLDTDVLIEIFDKESEKGERAFSHIDESGEDIFITSINLHEILYGLKKSNNPTEEVLKLPVLDYTKRDARTASALELKAERKGKPTRRTNAMIAAVTVNNAGKLYTFDKSHFEPLECEGLNLFRPD